MANCDTCEKLRTWFIRAMHGNRVRIIFKGGPPVVTRMIRRTAKTLVTDAGEYPLKDIANINRNSGDDPRPPRRGRAP